MRTLKELQAEIEKLQKEKQTLTTLCEFIPEKLAVNFKSTYLSSGYSMGEKVIYTCNNKELFVEDNRAYYTGRGNKYTPTHGLIKIDFTKKALTAYCRTLKEMAGIEWQNKLSKNVRNDIQQELRLARAQTVISQRFEEFCEKGIELKKIVLENINYK